MPPVYGPWPGSRGDTGIGVADPANVAGRGDGNDGDMVVIPLLIWSPGEE